MNDMLSPGKARYAELAEQMLKREECARGTMMGFPCLRRSGAFFACLHRNEQALIIKVSESRVEELVAEGLGEHFAPNGKVFREWVAIPVDQAETWTARIDEAWRFAEDA